MLIVTYDIHSDEVRAKFSRLLKKYGRRLQYSVFEIKNSKRILNLLLSEIELNFKPKFTWADSIIIIPVSDAVNQKVLRYWQPALEEEDILFL